jgi:putative glutathione S-transferase
MFNSAFNHLTGNTTDYYPASLQNEIDSINDRVYDTINNGVYRAGFATTQQAYQAAFEDI